MDAAIEHVAGERPEDELAVTVEGRVTVEANSVADAVRTVGQRVGDEFEIRRLAGMNRDVEVSLTGEREGLGV
jgi:hypothetical protein